MPLLGVQTGPIREDEFDPAEMIDFAEAFGFTVERSSERERREHRAACRPLVNDPRAADTAEGQTTHGRNP